jgi:2-amino-4-hydroxy-6-hydroxymethyldihydropteridine diphosphokinase
MNLILGLGSNLGDKLGHLRAAVAALKATPHISVVQNSPIYETPPWGAAGSPAFLNACVLIKTTLPLDAVLGVCLGIEAAQGRARDEQNQFAPRIIDIDVLFAGEARSQAPHLYVPHPRLHLRAFALKPALDVWPHPQLQAWYALPAVQTDAATIVKTAHSL